MSSCECSLNTPKYDQSVNVIWCTTGLAACELPNNVIVTHMNKHTQSTVATTSSTALRRWDSSNRIDLTTGSTDLHNEVTYHVYTRTRPHATKFVDSSAKWQCVSGACVFGNAQSLVKCLRDRGRPQYRLLYETTYTILISTVCIGKRLRNAYETMESDVAWSLSLAVVCSFFIALRA